MGELDRRKPSLLDRIQTPRRLRWTPRGNCIETLGGSTEDLSGVSDTVGRKRWRLDDDGRVADRVDSANQPVNDCMPFAYVRIVAPSEAEFRRAKERLQGDGIMV